MNALNKLYDKNSCQFKRKEHKFIYREREEDSS